MSVGGGSVTVMVYAGSSAPAKLTASFVDALQRVEVIQKLDGIAGFKITLNLQLPFKQSSELPILKDGTVAPGKRVKIGVRIGSSTTVLTDGVVGQHELHRVAGSDDEFTYDVFGWSLMSYMDVEQLTTEWPGRSSAQIVTEVLDKYAKYGLTANVVAPSTDYTPTVEQWIKQQNSSDLQVVRSLGEPFAYIFTIRPGASMSAQSVAYWGPPSRDGSPLPSLAVRMGSRAVKSSQFTYDAAGAEKAKGGTRTDTDEDNVLPVESSPDLGAKALATASSAASALARTKLFIEPGLSGVLAKSFADAQAQRSARRAARMTADIDGFVYPKAVTAGALLPVRGAGMLHDGVYYVEEVKHVLERGAYTQSVTMTREGLGSTITQAQ
jgi:phage protein D